jgi:hypothetical protein
MMATSSSAASTAARRRQKNSDDLDDEEGVGSESAAAHSGSSGDLILSSNFISAGSATVDRNHGLYSPVFLFSILFFVSCSLLNFIVI